MIDPKDSKKPRPNSRLRSYARFSGIAFQMLIIIGLGAYGGVKLDEAYPNNYSIFTIICSLAAIAVAMYFVIKQANSINKKQ